MEILKKKSVAILCMVLMMVGSTFIQANVDLHQEVNRIETMFLLDEGEGFSIQGKLESKMEFSNELANKFAIQFLDSGSEAIQAVNEAINQLRNASDINEKYEASLVLDQANNQLIGVLEQVEMQDKNKKELERFYANLQNCNDQISHSGYNEAAKKSAAELDSSLASFFRGLFGIELPQQYQ